MAREKGTLPISANFEPQTAAPFDARFRVPTKAEILLAATWTASDGNIYAYEGMLTVVYNDGVENGVYTLNSADYTNINNWIKSGGIDQATLDAKRKLLSCGVVTEPTITDLSNGLINIASCTARLNSQSDFSGQIEEFTIPALNNLQLIANQLTYIAITYNSGIPIYSILTSNTSINHSTILNGVLVYWENLNAVSELHVFYTGNYGLGLANKTSHRLIHTDRFGYESGLALSEYGTRNIRIEAGILWYDSTEISTLLALSGANNFHHYYKVSGVWNVSKEAQYPNTVCDNGTNLVTLGNNKYTSIFVFKAVANNSDAYFILGSQYNSVSEALAALLPTLPDIITKTAKYVGRIVIQKSASTASVITNELQNANIGQVTSQNHNDLANIQGGANNDYNHLTTAQVTTLNNAQPKITIAEGNIVIGGASNTLIDSNIHYSLIGV